MSCVECVDVDHGGPVHVERIVQQTRDLPPLSLFLSLSLRPWKSGPGLLFRFFWFKETSHFGHTARIHLFQRFDTPRPLGFAFHAPLECWVGFGLRDWC